MEIYFLARNERSVRQFNWRSVSARSVLRSNQAATVCLRPSYRQITVSLFYWSYHRTAIWIMIKLVRPSDRAVVAHFSPPSTAAWRLAHLPLPGICSVVCLPFGRPSTRMLAWQLQPLSPPTTPSASRPRCPRLPSTARSPVPGRFSDFRRDTAASIVRCSHDLASTSAVAT